MIGLGEARFLKKKMAAGKTAFCCLSFALCFFLFQLIEFTVNDRAGMVFGPDYVTFIYSVGIFFSAVGFLAFSFFYKRLNGKGALKPLLLTVGLLLALSSALLVVTSSRLAFALSSLSALFLCGILNSAMYFCFSLQFSSSRFLGRMVGIGMGVMVLLQFVVQSSFKESYWAVFIVCVAVGTAAVLCFLIRQPFAQTAPCPQATKASRPRAFVLVAATAVMTAVVVLSDGICVEKHAEGILSVSAMARLFYAFSLMAAGFVADIKNRKYFSLTTICALFISAISNALISPPTYFIAVSMLYVYCGFYVVFLTVNFIEIAPQQREPHLWVGMGRIVRSLVTSVTVLPALWMYDRFGNIILIAGSIVLSIITLLILLKDIAGSWLEVPPPRPDAPDFDAVKAEFSLTEKEQTVLRYLLLTEDSVQNIADQMFISRRVLQRHISSIYKKTGTSSRAGLLRKLIAFSSDEK